MRKFYLSLFSLLFVFAARSQAINTYTFAASAGTFTPLVGGTVVPSLQSDDASSTTPIPLGFYFYYGGTPYTSVTANSNGWLSFNSSPTTSTTTMRTNNLSATSAGIHPIIAPLWDDLDGRSINITPAPVASYLTTGTAGNRVFTFEWLRFGPFNADSSNISFQVKLYEATGVVQFIYNREAGTANFSSATAGISGSATDFLSLNNLGAAPTISSTTSTNNITVRPASGQTYTFTPATPPPACSGTPTPGTITGPASICNTQTANLSITGNSVSTGLFFQWYIATSTGGPYTPISGATATTYTTTPLTTTSYFIATVSCGTNTSTTQEFAVNVPPAFPAGTYTINSALPTGGSNFHSFSDAVSAIGCGIAGPVVFNVAPGTSYNEQVIIPQIGGTSATNTITFNGNGSIISFASGNTNQRAVITLDGADYIIINNLKVDASAGTFGWGIFLTNQADHNTIINSKITSSITSTSTNYAGIVISSSATSATNSGTNGNFNTIKKDTISGGYYTIAINGNSVAPYGQGNVIDSNVVDNSYFYNIYATYQNGMLIRGNDIKRTQRTNGSTFNGIYLASTLASVTVEGNRIHNINDAGTSQSNAAYGIYINGPAASGVETRVFNNIIYNFNNATGLEYGIYMNDQGINVYHNSISLDQASATAGITRGISESSYANHTIKDNIINITRGGTGIKHGIYASTTTLVEDYDDVFVTGTALFGYWNGADQPTLAAWRTASGRGANSMSIDPQFASAATGNLFPNNALLDGTGTPVGLTYDILGQARSTVAPEPGAYEIPTLPGLDLGARTLKLPVQKTCYSNAETVTVTIRNYSVNAQNFAVSPVTVTASVTGTNPTTFAPVIINTGTLASGDSLDVVISSNFNMSAPGTYTFNASTTVAGDANTANNAMAATQITVVAVAAGTASSTPPSYCMNGGIPTLSLTGNSGSSGVQWQESSSATGPWTNVGTNSITYTPSVATTANRYYRAYATCQSNSDTSNVVTVALNVPQVVSTIPVTRCGPGTVPLFATASAGATLNWYTAASGGTLVGTGTTFTTPIINTNTTYYVAANIGGGSSDVGLLPTATNCGTITTSTLTDWPLRFNTTAPVTINSAYVIPQAAGTFVVALRNTLSTTDIQTASFTFTAAQVGVPTQINLNWAVPASGSYQLTNTTGGVGRIPTFTCAYPYSSALGNFKIVGSATSSTSATNVTTYNTFFRVNVSEGCESPRVAVLASITPAATFTVTPSTTICNNVVQALTVTSNTASFNNYIWTPSAGLYTDVNATTAYTGGSATTVYMKTATAGTYTYVATANNTSNSCQNIDSTKITVLPANVTITSNTGVLCVSGTAGLSLNPATGYTGSNIQWFSSADGTNYTTITGANTAAYTTPTITATTYYRAVIKDASGNSCQQPAVTVTVNSPQVLTSTPAARCGAGTVNLAATGSAATTLNWYTAATGGSLVGTGNSFTTPSLPATTVYYVSAFSTSSTGTGGRATPLTASTGANGDDNGIVFSASQPFTLTSVDVYPTSLTTQTTISVQLLNSSGSVLFTAGPFTIPVGTGTTLGGGATPVTLNLGFNIPVGTGYRLRSQGMVGSLVRDNPIGTSFSYPLTIGTVGSVTSGWAAGATSSASYYFFYNLKYTTGCESPRVAVTATVSDNTAISAQPANQASCAGSSITLSVTATGAGLTYQWRKNGTNISGATGSTYTINPAAIADAGNYDVVINGLCGNITSSAATVTVAANNSWLGAINNDWNNPGNWCGGIPTNISDVVINSGTPFQPTLNSVGEVHNLTISSGATVTVAAGGFMNIYGNFSNSGTFTAPNGVITFKGTANQTIGTMSAGTVLINGAGITLAGNMTIGTALILTNGNITLGTSNLVLNGSINGSAASHVVTSGTGSVISNNIGSAAVTIPVGPDATHYNPVIINNGQGLNYTVRVATGISPAILNAARAINRTWNITASGTPAAPVNVVLQFADGDQNGSASPTLVMEVGVNNGTTWNVVSPAIGVTPSGISTAYQVGYSTTLFGPTVVANIGGLTNPLSTPNVDADVNRIVIMPNPVQDKTVLRVQTRRAMKINWLVIDANGRVVMGFGRQVMAGQTDIQLSLGALAGGTYQIIGLTEKGKTQVVRFVKL